VTASWKHKQQLQQQRLILSTSEQSLLLEFAGAKSCRVANGQTAMRMTGCWVQSQGSAKKKMGNWCAPCVHGKLVLQEWRG